MKKLIPLVVLFVAAAVAIVVSARKHRNDGLVLSGTVEARDVRVGSLVGGRVRQVHADEGDRVAKGAPLVTLESDLLDPQVAEQEAAVSQAQAQLDALRTGPRKEEIERARLQWRNSEAERKRLKRLLDDGVIGRDAYEKQETTAAWNLEALRQLERGSRAEDIAAAEAAVARAEGRLALLRRQQAELIVTSPADARVQSLDLRPGDLVTAGQPVAELVEDGQTWVRVFVPETKLGLVQPGMRVNVTVDTFPGRVFAGRIASVRDRGEYTPRNVQTLEQRSDQVFGVRIDLDDAPELKPGMAATAVPVADGGAAR